MLASIGSSNSVDELERVAATYLLRPSGSIHHSSFTVADDRYADDGSVYIYREENGPSSAQEQVGEERNIESSGGRNSRNRATLSRDVERDRRNRWVGDQRNRWEGNQRNRCEGGGGEVSALAVTTGNSNNRDRRQIAPGGDRAGISSERSVNGSNAARGEPPTDREGGGDTAAGIHHRDRSGEGQMLQQSPKSSDADQASAKGAGDDDCQKGGAPAPHGGRPGQDDNRGLFDDCTSHPDRGRPEDAPLETLDTGPGAGASRSTGRERAPREDVGGNPDAESSCKVEQIAARLREMILDRQASAGRSIRQVFGHFDRRRCGYVNVSEMRDALSDLRLNVSSDQTQVS